MIFYDFQKSILSLGTKEKPEDLDEFSGAIFDLPIDSCRYVVSVERPTDCRRRVADGRTFQADKRSGQQCVLVKRGHQLRCGICKNKIK